MQIAILNTDYKILTSVITNIIHENIPQWIIPVQQLARKGVWGTVHGFLWDKSYSQVARPLKVKNYSMWFDFTKAYDSITHIKLRRLIEVFPLSQNTIKAMMKRWSIVIKIGEKTTTPIYVRRGVHQGAAIGK